MSIIELTDRTCSRARALMRASGIFHTAVIALLLSASGAALAQPDAEMFGALTKLPQAYTESFDGRRPAGWVVDDAAKWLVDDGRYTVNVKGEATSVSTYSPATWPDCFVEVDCKQGSAPGSPAGVVLQASSESKGSGYFFSLRKDGKAWQFSVIRRTNGLDSFLQPWTASRAIEASGNHLSALCFSGLLQFYANNQLLWEGYDSALPPGHVGLFGSAADGKEVLHAFDNVSVRLVADPGRATPVVPAPIPAPVPTDDQAKRDPAPSTNAVAGATDPAPEVTDKSPLLRPGLLVRVTVYVSGKREIDAEVKRVSDNSQLDMPLVGNVDVGGMTLRDLNSTLQARYRDYFINPQVVAEFVVEESRDAVSPWGSVVVLGRVKTPGRVNIPPTQDLTVSAAIQQAGGLDTSAKTSAIRLTRRNADGGTEQIYIDFTSVGKRGSVENDLILKPGDRIFVPESIL